MDSPALSLSALDWWVASPSGSGKALKVSARPHVLPLRLRDFPYVLDWYEDKGQHLLFSPDAGDNANLWRVPVDSRFQIAGPPERISHGPGRQSQAVVGFDATSRRLVFSDEVVNLDIFTLDIDLQTGLPRGTPRQITDRLSPELNSSLSGDGQHAYFVTTRMGSYAIMRKDLDTGRERTLFTSPTLLYNSSISGDGRTLFFANRSIDIAAIPSEGGAMERVCPGCGSVTGPSEDGSRILYEPVEDEHLVYFDRALGKTLKLADRGGPDWLLTGGRFSPDGRWVVFQAVANRTKSVQVFLIPIDGPLPRDRSQWIPVTDPAEMGSDPVWSRDGNRIFFLSERDGFRCLWSRRLDPATKRPAGEPVAAGHFHASRQGFRSRASSGNMVGLYSGGSRVIFALTETTGNIWVEESPIAK
jgi:eukaryotic-like serine/threonine-protein kinase